MNINDLIGVPFVDGGRDPAKGLDCWGLAMEVFRRHGITLPDYPIGSAESVRIDRQILEERPLWNEHFREDAPIPSLVVVRFCSKGLINHCGVLVSSGKFIHTREKIGVNIDRLDTPYWNHRIVGFFTPSGRTSA